jgi:hypothetical protein
MGSIQNAKCKMQKRKGNTAAMTDADVTAAGRSDVTARPSAVCILNFEF